MLYILAGDDRQAHAAADWLELDRKRWRRITDGRELQGVESPKLLLFGRYWENPRYPQVMDVVKIMRGFVSVLEDRR